MSHSKRNTSLAFFTNHERALLRNTWGTQSTRLSRDSFLPFGSCRLCLMSAKDPVACGGLGHSAGHDTSSSNKVHLFCRECALNDLVQQRKEIKRLEMDALREKDEAEDEQMARDEESRRKEVARFECSMQGYDDPGGEVGRIAARGVKRKAEELHSSSTDRKRLDHSSQNGASEPATSFWIPGRESINNPNSFAQKPAKKLKPNPLCPGSTPTTKHTYSLKSLVPVHFTTENNTRSSSSQPTSPTRATTPICPSCQKSLTNTSRATLATPCGHVICGGCVDQFMLPPKIETRALSTHSNQAGGQTQNNSTPLHVLGRISCYVCSTDLTPPVSSTFDKKTGNGDKKTLLLLEISTEGTGFAGYAGGGENGTVTKREGVVFQC